MPVEDAKELFKKHFRMPPTFGVRAPGRLELLGNHTDYNEGLVLSLAVDRHIEIAVGARNDGKIELVSSAFASPEIFWVDQIKRNPAAAWADYCKGVLEQLRRRGVHFSGFNAAIHGTIPPGAGMSSSAALEVATALAVRQLFPYKLSDTGVTAPPARDTRGKLPAISAVEKMAIAKVCQAAETKFVGVRVGLLDPVSSLFGEAGKVMEIDFRSLTVSLEPLPGEAIVVCNSGVKHALVGGEYNELRRNCEAAARALGVASLRSVDAKFLAANKNRLTEREYECAYHIVGENQRVAAAVRALRENDHRQVGEYMFQSHASSRDFFRNSAPELDLLVELAKDAPGCLGARLTGGGFGGATINLVAHHQAEEFMAAMRRGYEAKTGKHLDAMICQISAGAA